MQTQTQTPTLADVMLEAVLPEAYHPIHLRKSNEKARAAGGGRTPSQIVKWSDFEDKLNAWWISAKNALTGHASRLYPKDCMPGISISKKDEVRGALASCVFAPINEALGALGLHLPFRLNTTESILCVKSNIDWAGFIVDPRASDVFQECCLPIEVKGPWQFQLSIADGHVVDLLVSPNAQDRDKVRFAVAQLYLYMILEQAEFGILCTKEQYVFFKRTGRPSSKILSISKTCSCMDPIGIRRCILFMCHLAYHSSVTSRAAVDQVGLEVPSMARSMGRQSLAFEIMEEPPCFEILNLEDLLPHIYRVPPMLSAENIASSQQSWLRDVGVIGQRLDHWFQSLAEFDLLSFQLGRVLSSCGKIIVREACICNQCAIIKMFDLVEDQEETLSEFYQEVCAYTVLAHLQGVAIPKLLAYGSIWGGYLGFVALSWEGRALRSKELHMQPNLCDAAISSLRRIHNAEVLHGDISFHNMVVSHESVKFVDFGRSSVQAKHEYLSIELEELEELLQGGLSLDFDVSED